MANINIVPYASGLLELLRKSVGNQFVIPVYQRNYTWTANKDVKQLFEDLRVLLKGERQRHFIGIMIYLEKSLSPFHREFSVIDGQQRLTTIFLILYAIREYFMTHGMEDMATQLDTQYLTNSNTETYKLKLKPLVSDDDVYRQIVARDFEHIDNKTSNIYINFRYIQSEIDDLLNTYSIDQLLDAINKLYIVCVPIGEEDYPQKIFESINATGEKLTASDLIRNFMLMPIESEKQEKYYGQYWKKLEDLIDSDSKKLEAFFRFFITAKRQIFINKSQVYRAFTDWHTESIATRSNEDIFKELVKYAYAHNLVYKSDLKGINPALAKQITEFRLILSDMPAPLLMELFVLHAEGKISADQLAEILNVLNSYLMRRSLCGLPTSDITRLFPVLLKDILNACGDDFSNIVEEFKKYLVYKHKGDSQEMPTDKKLAETILNANMYNYRSWVAILFKKWELLNNSAPADLSKLSIEHLMPQTPTPEWFAMLECDRETYETNLHRLGNLTLAAAKDNSKMSNKGWEYKNKVLASTAHLRINMPLLKKEHWTIADIDARTLEWIEIIKSLYPYFDANEVNKIAIHIDGGNAHATGYFFPDNGSVMVEAGSTLSTVFPNASSYPECEDLRAKLKEDGYIDETDGQLVFVKDCPFYAKAGGTGLSRSACIILHGARNGKQEWFTENDEPIANIINSAIE